MKTDKQVLTDILKAANVKGFKILFILSRIDVKRQSDLSLVSKAIEGTRFKNYSIVYGFI